MMKKQLRSVIAGTAIVVAMGSIGLGVVGSAQAQQIKSSSVTVLDTSMTRVNDGPHGGGKNVAAIASVLKLTEAELKTQVQSGKTLAQIATAQGVDVKVVIDTIVADVKTHIADEVTSGEITQAQADTKLAGLTAKVTEMVNTVRPARGEGHGKGHGPRGHHNKNEEAPNA
jgi:hypothetical protein